MLYFSMEPVAPKLASQGLRNDGCDTASGELEAENWRLCSTTLVRGVSSWTMRTGDFVVQLLYAEYLWSWKLRTGDFLVQL